MTERNAAAEQGRAPAPPPPPPLPPLPPAIGLDFGTSYVSAAVFKDNEVKLIKDQERGGATAFPSYVSFNDDPDSSVIMVGKEARDLALLNPTNTVYGFKRLIGHTHQAVQSFAETPRRTFEVAIDKSNPQAVVIKVNRMGRSKTYTPEELSTMVVEKVVEIGGTQLGVPVRDAVVTVPASFNYLQREKLRQLCEAAGLNVLRFVDEATATAVCYGLTNRSRDRERNILVVNLGGGFLSVAVVTIRSNITYEVKSIASDPHLGGCDFDDRVVKYLVEQFEKKTNVSLSGNASALWLVKRAASIAKRALSTAHEVPVRISHLHNDTSLDAVITREKFKELNDGLFKRVLQQIENALNDAQLSKSQIQDVLMAGGSARIPKIQSMVRNFFDGKEPKLCNNPSQAPAYGAAILAASIQGDGFMELDLIPVNPFSIGIESVGGVVTTVIKRNTPLPAEKRVEFVINTTKQKDIEISVYEGERRMAKDNLFLGKLCFRNIIPSARAGDVKFEVCVSLDQSGLCQVSVENTTTKRKEKLTMSVDTMTVHKRSLKPILFQQESAENDTRHIAQGTQEEKDDGPLYMSIADLEQNSPSEIKQSENPPPAGVSQSNAYMYIPLPPTNPTQPNLVPASQQSKEPIATLSNLPALAQEFPGLVQSYPPKADVTAIRETEPQFRKTLRERFKGWNKSKSQENLSLLKTSNDGVASPKDERAKYLLEQAIVEANNKVRQAEIRAKNAEERAEKLENEIALVNQKVKDTESKAVATEEQFYKLVKMYEEAEEMVKEERERAEIAERRTRDVEQQLQEATQRAMNRRPVVSRTWSNPDQMNLWVIQNDEIELTDIELGRGGWAFVKVAKFRGLKCAAKCIHSAIVSDYNRHLFVREMNIAAQLRHPNLVQFIGATMEPKKSPIILTELMHCSLRSVLEKMPFNPPQITSISLDIARALNYLHLMQPDPVIHRDVSSANVLLNQGPPPGNTYVAKISDYGSANFARRANTAAPGSPAYAAPESLESSKHSPKMDVYSYGVLLLEICTRKFPDPDSIDRNELLGKVNARMPNMVELIRKCMEEDLHRRPTMSQLLELL